MGSVMAKQLGERLLKKRIVEYTVDGSEIRPASWYGKYPIIYCTWFHACWVVSRISESFILWLGVMKRHLRMEGFTFEVLKYDSCFVDAGRWFPLKQGVFSWYFFVWKNNGPAVRIPTGFTAGFLSFRKKKQNSWEDERQGDIRRRIGGSCPRQKIRFQSHETICQFTMD